MPRQPLPQVPATTAMLLTQLVAASVALSHAAPLVVAAKKLLTVYAAFTLTHCASLPLLSPAAPAMPVGPAPAMPVAPPPPPPPPLSLLHAPTASAAAVTATKSVMKRRIRHLLKSGA